MAARTRRGLTAIELATVVGLLGIIVTLTLPAANAARGDAQRDLARMALAVADQQLHTIDDRTTLPEPATLQLPDGVTVATTASNDPQTLQLGATVGGDRWVLAAAAGDRCWFALHDPDRTVPTRWAVHDRNDQPCATDRLHNLDLDRVTGGRRTPTDLDRSNHD